MEYEDQYIKDNNKYLNYKQFDMADIFAFGIMPKFGNEADGFMCAKQAGIFINNNGLGMVENLVKFLEILETHNRIVFSQQLDIKNLERLYDHKLMKPIIKDLMKTLVD